MTSTHTQREAKTFAQLFKDAEVAANGANDNEIAFEREYHDWIDAEIGKCNRGEKAQARGYIIELQAPMSFHQFCEELEKVYRGEEAQVRLQPLSPTNFKRKGCRVYDLLPELKPADKSAGKGNGADTCTTTVAMTFFPDQYAKSMQVETLTLQELADRITSTAAREKTKLPFFKLATFNGEVNPDNLKAGCLRCDANVVEITGVEGDKDTAPLEFEEAADKLAAAGLRALLYTSASPGHFRVVCPASGKLKPTERGKLIARLNGVLGGALSPESFTLSQSYYYGHVKGKPAPLIRIIDGDFIDLRPDLDAGALGKTKTKADDYYPDNVWAKYAAEQTKIPIDVDKLLANMESGCPDHSIHYTQLSVIAALLCRGVAADEAVATVLERTMEVTEIPSAKTHKTQTKKLWGMVESWLRKHPELVIKAKADKPQQEQAAAVEPVDLWAQREAPPLPKGLLPKVIEKFAFRQAKLMGCDPAGLAMGALVVCCAAIPDRIKLQVKKHDVRFKQSTRIWVAFAGPPSVVKSPIMDRVIEPLNRIDAKLSNDYHEALAAYQTLEGEEKKNAEKPRHLRVRFEDVTPEAAQPILRDSPDGELLARDELSGWFGSIDKYSGARGGGMDRGFWLQAFNGGHYSWDRVSRGSGNIPNLSICVLGGIQEEPLRKLVSDGVDDGLIQRLFIILLRRAVMGTDEPQPDDHYDELVERLYALRNKVHHPERHFSEEAQVIRRQLEQQHLDLAAGYEKINKRLAAHIDKYKGLFARLCLLWHTIETLDDKGPWPGFIGVDIAQRVAKFMNEFLLQHAIAFYIGLLGLSDQHDRLLDVGGFILARKLDTLTTRDIQRGSRSMREMEKRDTDRICEQLEAYGWLERQSGKRYSDVVWLVNPEVHRLFPEKAKEERERRQREQAEIIASMPKRRGTRLS